MKRIVCLFLVFFSLQYVNAQKPTFLRLYNSNGKKINKGELFLTSDTSITLIRKNILTETPVSDIKLIKSNRTTGRRILTTTLNVAGVAFLLAGALYSLSRPHSYGNSVGNKSPGRNKSRSGYTVDPMQKTSKPLKKYKVDHNLETWAKQRKLVNQLL